MAKFETLTDDFSAPTLDPAKWTFTNSPFANGSATIVGGALDLTLASAAADNTCYVRTVDTYDCANTYVLAKVVAGATAGGVLYSSLSQTVAGSDETAMIYVNASTIYFYGRTASYQVYVNVNIPYVAATMAWWRIRHTAGVMYFETAPDGNNWTIRAQGTHTPTVPKRLELSGRSSNGFGPFTTTLDSVNLPPPLTSSLVDDFSGLALDTTKWTPTPDPTGVITIGVGGGTLNFESKSSASGAHSCSVRSVNAYVLTNSHFAAKLDLTFVSAAPTTQLKLMSTGSGEYFSMQKISTGNVQMRVYNTSGTVASSLNAAYDANAMAWWRIRNAGTVMYFETSPDGIAWTNRHNYTYTPTGPMYYASFEYVWSGATSVTATRFDNANNIPAYSVVDAETFEGPVVSAVGPPMKNLSDDFTAGTLDPAKWVVGYFPNQSGSNTAAVSGGQLMLSLGAGFGVPYGVTVTSVEVYDLRDSYLSVKVTPVAGVTQAQTFLRVINPSNPKEYFVLFKLAGTLYARAFDTAGNALFQYSYGYDGASQAWWRIRHTGTELILETGNDGLSWSLRGSATYTPSMRGMKAVMETSWASGTSQASVAYFDNINPVTDIAPVSITDTEALEAVQATEGRDVAADSTLDIEEFGEAEATFWYEETADLESAGDPELVGDVTLLQNIDTGPDSTADPDGTGDPEATVYAPLTPGSLTDTETFGAPTVPLLYAPMSTLVESWGTGVFDPARWTVSNFDQYLTASVTGGMLTFTAIVGPSGSHGAIVRTIDGLFYDLNNSSIIVQAFPVTTSNAPATTFMLYGSTGAESFYIQKLGTTVTFRGYDDVGTQIGTASPGYNAGTMAWWRIRHTGTSLYWETSGQETGPWQAQLTRTYTPKAPGFGVRMEVTWTGTTSAHTARFDNINNIPSYSTIDPETFGPPVANATGPKFDTLTDDFSGAALDPAKWTYSGTASSGAGVSNNQMMIYVNAGLPAPWGMIVASTEVYDLRDTAVFARMTPYLHSQSATFMAVRNPANPLEYFAVYRQSTTLYFKAQNTDGVLFINTTATYSAANHAWWRIRHDGVYLNMETSANGVIWTTQANNPWTPSTRAMRLQFELTTMSGTSVNATSYIDNVNVDLAARPGSTADPETFGTPELTSVVIPDYPVDPDALADPETLGDPETVLGGPPSVPDGIADLDYLGDPAHTFDGDPLGIPDSIYEPETLPEPTATTAGTELIGVTEGPNDPEALGYPETSGLYSAAPDPLIDAEILTGPSLLREGIELESLNDPELFGLLTVLQTDTPVTVGELADPETLDPPVVGIVQFEVHLNDAIIDGEEFGPPYADVRKSDSNFSYGSGVYGDGIYSGYVAPPDSGQTPNYTYGTGTYGYGIYYGLADTENPPGEETLPIVPPADYPVAQSNLSIGPWSPGVEWRGAPNYQIPPTRLTRAEAEQRSIGIATGGPTTTRPAMGLPPATRKGFTLRLNEGSEARVDLAMQRGDAVVIDEMDTDIWWRRKDPVTGKLEMIGRFNCSHADLTASDSSVNLSAQFVDYSVLLGDRMILTYKFMGTDKIPETMWPADTPVMDILDWALPLNTGIDMSQVRQRLYNLGTITSPFDLPPGTLITDMMENLKAVSRVQWEWWVETPEAVDKAPILRFVAGERGSDKGVTLFDVGSGPTPIASWSRTGSTDDYANTLYFTGGGTGTGEDAGGGVIVQIPAQVGQYGQHDAQDGNTSLGGDLEKIQKGAETKLAKLADRTPTFTIGLAFGFWKGREHIDVGDTVRLILRLGKDVTDVKYRVTEIAVDIDENNMEDVTLTLGRPRASNDPRSKRSPLMRIIRTFRNYKAPGGKLKDTTSEGIA